MSTLGRRGFLCVCCAGLAVGAAGLSAAPGAAAPGARRTILNTTDYLDGKHVVIQAAVEVDPGFAIPLHTHPGIEAAFILEGGGELVMPGRPDRAVKAGDSFEIPTGAVHALRNGPALTKVMVTYVVEKDQPLSTPAPA